MKTLNVKTVVYEMLIELSRKKSKGDIEKWLEAEIKRMYGGK